jgi:Subunit ChlI of Mg-chelatase
LSAAGLVPKDGLAGTVFPGELGLDGRIRPVPGILPSIAAAAGAGFGGAVVPRQNAAEAALVPSMRVISAETLGALIDWLRFGDPDASGSGVQVLQSGAGLAVATLADADSGQGRDLADVVGQPVARRGAEICGQGPSHAAAGAAGMWQPDTWIKGPSTRWPRGHPAGRRAEPRKATDDADGKLAARHLRKPGRLTRRQWRLADFTHMHAEMSACKQVGIACAAVRRW